MFAAPFFRSSDTATIVGWLYIILVSSVGGPYIGTRLSTDTSEATWFAIMLLPSFALFRSLYFAGALNAGGKGVVLNSEVYQGVQLGMCRGRGPFCRTYAFFVVQWIVLVVFGLYFDRVLPGAVGGRSHPLFFLGFKRGARKSSDGDVDIIESAEEDEADVRGEQSRADLVVEGMAENQFDGVVVRRLEKTYYTTNPPVRALRGLSFAAKRGEIMGILGHNGAG